MEIKEAANLLHSLGSEQRLRIFRSLAGHGRDGISAGELAGDTGIPANTLSFHLKELSSSALVSSNRNGRSIIYRLNEERTRDLLSFLMADCAIGNPVPQLSSEGGRAVFNQIKTMEPEKQNILFVCQHNSARSQMAEALLKKYVEGEFNVFSAGYSPRPIDPLAIKVMNEIGVDISEYQSKSTGDFLGWTRILYAVFVCQTSEEDCPKLYPFAHEQIRWTIPAPNIESNSEVEKLNSFRAVRDQLDEKIREFAEELKAKSEV